MPTIAEEVLKKILAVRSGDIGKKQDDIATKACKRWTTGEFGYSEAEIWIMPDNSKLFYDGRGWTSYSPDEYDYYNE